MLGDVDAGSSSAETPGSTARAGEHQHQLGEAGTAERGARELRRGAAVHRGRVIGEEQQRGERHDIPTPPCGPGPVVLEAARVCSKSERRGSSPERLQLGR